MRKLLILLLLVTFRLVTIGQVYQEMPQYGYRANRMAFDSTLQIPTFCGVPTLRSVVKVNKNGAIAFDSCNNKLYRYNPKTLTWAEIGGATDTTSLSNRINQRIDSIRLSGDSIFVRKNGVFVFQYKDSVGGDFWKTSGTTDLTGNVNIQSDSRILFKGINNELPRFQINADSLIFVNSGNGYTYLSGLTTTTDTSTYKPLGIDGTGKLAPLTSWASGGGGDFWKTSGTTILGGADTIVSDNGALIFIGGAEDMARFSVQANDIDLTTSGGAVGISMSGLDALTDTLTYKPLMISSSGVLKKSTSWVSGGGVAVDTIFRTLGKDSIFYKKYGITYAIKDSVGGGDTAKVVIAQVHNATTTTLLRGEVVFLFGSNGNVASVKRANNKDDSTSARTIGIVRSNISAGSNGFITTQGQVDKLNLGAYAEGDVLYLDSIDGQFTKIKPQAPYHSVFIGIVERANNGNGLAYIKVQNGVELDEVHDVQINNILNNQIIVYSDTQKVFKNRNVFSIVDTTTLFATKSNVALKLNATDTASLSKRINEKLTNLDLLQSLSYGAKAEPYGVTLSTITSQLTLTTTRLNLYPFNWNVSDSIRGIAFLNRGTTTLTQNNYNGVAIYSLSGGTLTRLTFTANNGTFWDGTANTWKSQAITPFFLNKGVYYLGYQMSGSAGTPTIASGQIMQTGLIELPSALNPNGVKISSFISNATTTPPSSIAMSTTTTQQQVPYFILY